MGSLRRGLSIIDGRGETNEVDRAHHPVVMGTIGTTYDHIIVVPWGAPTGGGSDDC